jgi:hypothetical protein
MYDIKKLVDWDRSGQRILLPVPETEPAVWKLLAYIYGRNRKVKEESLCPTSMFTSSKRATRA